MNRCATCKYYGNDYDPDKDGVADCGFVGTIQATENKATHLAIEATAADDQGLNAVLMVGAEFGCIHHTERKFTNRDKEGYWVPDDNQDSTEYPEDPADEQRD